MPIETVSLRSDGFSPMRWTTYPLIGFEAVRTKNVK